ncbi:hypothetical protein [Amaricoccus sp. W119]|uniref:hypothetical protein n=1 Tax=Amaricoccus sp. W119 TaxID=3391833 RepID=UPI0039A68815
MVWQGNYDKLFVGGAWVAPKGRDARWTLKRGRRKRRPDGTMMEAITTPIFGYKSHINIDRTHGLIRNRRRSR